MLCGFKCCVTMTVMIMDMCKPLLPMGQWGSYLERWLSWQQVVTHLHSPAVGYWGPFRLLLLGFPVAVIFTVVSWAYIYLVFRGFLVATIFTMVSWVYIYLAFSGFLITMIFTVVSWVYIYLVFRGFLVAMIITVVSWVYIYLVFSYSDFYTGLLSIHLLGF